MAAAAACAAQRWRAVQFGQVRVTSGVEEDSYIRSMGRVDVDPKALSTFAARCGGLATVVVPGITPGNGPSAHAAAMAVEALHSAVNVAAGALASRLEETSDVLCQCASEFAQHDIESSNRLAMLKPSAES